MCLDRKGDSIKLNNIGKKLRERTFNAFTMFPITIWQNYNIAPVIFYY